MHVLLVGDFVKHTGFGRVNEAIARGLKALGHTVSVLAVRYTGDPTPLQTEFDLYPAGTSSDYYGMQRLVPLIAHTRPDVVLIVNDSWIVNDYLQVLERVNHGSQLSPIAAYMPVDGPHLDPGRQTHLNNLDLAVAYTRFGADELTRAGLEVPTSIIPHGIDLETFGQGDQWEARRKLGIPDGFVVLVSDSNSSRKRLDLAIEAFARFAKDAPDAWLLIHSEEDTRWGWNLPWLCRKHGILDQAFFTGKHGSLTDRALHAVYTAADVYLSASMGEGWGFGAMEAMACGVPVIAVDWAALGEWAQGAARLHKPQSTFTYAASANQEGGVVSPASLAASLDQFRANRKLRTRYRDLGLARVAEPQFRWDAIAVQWEAVLQGAIASAAERTQEGVEA